MHVCINPVREDVAQLYENHKESYHGDSGLNLFTPVETLVPARSTVTIPLGIKVALYEKKGDAQSLSFFVIPRSSISKTPLRLANAIGLIDAGYRGELVMCLDNIYDKPYRLQRGDRLVQLVAPNLQSGFTVELVDKLDSTERGERGYGSSGR